MTGEHLKFLYHVFHTRTITWLFKHFYAGGGLGEEGYRYKKAFFEKLPIPHINIPLNIGESNAESIVQNMYGLTDNERIFILT